MKKKIVDRPPVTEPRLRQDLRELGVREGSLVVVHSSLSSLGWVLGGAPPVVRSLVDALGPEGTLAMPAATPLCADPATWESPRIPDGWLEEVREHLPVFDPETTPTSLGAIPETFRNWPGTLRSHHPIESVCARGPLAAEIVRDHPLEYSEGPGSPFAKLHELGAWILLLGVGFNRCTALHFAESLVENRRTTSVRFPLLEEGRRIWKEVPNVADDNDTHLPRFGERFLAAGGPTRGRVGEARALLFSMGRLVAYARKYFEREL